MHELIHIDSTVAIQTVIKAVSVLLFVVGSRDLRRPTTYIHTSTCSIARKRGSGANI